MSVDSDFYDRLHAALPSSAIHAVKLPAGYQIGAAPVLVVVRDGDRPETTIDGMIVFRQARMEVSIYGSDLAAVRAARDAAITALHGYQGGAIKDCQLDDSSEGSDIDGIYHQPIYFSVMF